MKYDFEIDITKTVKEKIEIEYGKHYFLFEEDENRTIYAINIKEGDHLESMWAEIDFTKIFFGNQNYTLSVIQDHIELPWMVQKYLSKEKVGNVITYTEFNEYLREFYEVVSKVDA